MNQISSLKENDIYSMLLYAMYKFTGDSKYSTISELMYTLDKPSFMKLCAIFGGCTIKIPTVDEIQIYIKALITCMCVKEGKSLADALHIAEVDDLNKRNVLALYKTMSEVISEYENM